MKKTIAIILFSAGALAILGAPMKTDVLTKKYLPLSTATPALVPLQVRTPMESSTNEVTKYILIDEHFDGLTEGSEQEPSQTPLLSKADYYAGKGIDQSLIGGGSWTASGAYAAGGSVALISKDLMDVAYINTPIGDYSGEITVSFRAKPLEYNGNKKSYVYVDAFYGDFRAPNTSRVVAVTDMSFNLYAGDTNWTEVEMKFNNYTSNTDGYIQIMNAQGTAVLIDDLKITTSPSFVADPVLKPATYGTNTLTANWQPVRRAFDYYLRLYKKNNNGQGDQEYEEEFDDINEDGSNLPEGWTFNVNELQISQNGGYDGSKGIILKNGETLETPRNGAKYHNASLWLKSYYPSQEAADADEGLACIDVCRDGKWYPFAGYYMGMLYNEPAEDDMETLAEMYMTEFADRYDGIRVRITDSSCPEAYLVVDHAYISTGQPVTYELIPDNEGYDYTLVEGESFEIKFDNQEKNYPYHGLKQECDYAYSIQSHYLFQRSNEVFADLSGVYTPVAAKAEETPEGFKGVWDEVYAATGYRADYYGIKTLKNDSEDLPVLEEKFDHTICDTTNPMYPTELGNDMITDLSQYSDFRGWGGLNSVFVNGMMGFYGGYLVTPLINVPNSETVKVKLVYYATPYDILTMTDSEGKLYYNECTGSSDMNRTEAEFIVPVGSKPLELTLRSMYRLPVLIDEFTVLQDAKAGNKIYTYLGSIYEEAPGTSVSFTDLAATGFTGFAYCVTAMRDDAGSMLYSAPSNYRFVGTPQMIEGTPSKDDSGVRDAVAPDLKAVEFYSMEGIRLHEPVKGINIVRMSDGSTRKILVK